MGYDMSFPDFVGSWQPSYQVPQVSACALHGSPIAPPLKTKQIIPAGKLLANSMYKFTLYST